MTLISKMGHGAYRFLFCLLRLSILLLCITTTKLLHNHQTNKREKCWRSVDAHFQNGARSFLLFLVRIKNCTTSIMYNHYRIACSLPNLQDQKLLTLCWCSSSWWCRELGALCFAYKGWQHVNSVYSLPNRVFVTRFTGPRIVDAPLTLIVKMGQGAWCFLCCL